MTPAVLTAALFVFVWLSLRYAWWRPAVDYRCPRILMYHMIADPRPGARFNGLRVSPAMFERQLRWLAEHGWTAFTVSELIGKGQALPEKAFAITFDDGYADNFQQALPLLQKYRCKATLYLVVDRFERDWSTARKAHHNEGELLREPKLEDEQVQAMLDSGCVELGSHTLTHANFNTLDDSDLCRELEASRSALAQRFGVPVESFAYPFGLFKPEHTALVAAAGYTSAVTTDEGIESPQRWHPFELKRIKISGKDSWLAFLLRMRSGRRGL